MYSTPLSLNNNHKMTTGADPLARMSTASSIDVVHRTSQSYGAIRWACEAKERVSVEMARSSYFGRRARTSILVWRNPADIARVRGRLNKRTFQG